MKAAARCRGPRRKFEEIQQDIFSGHDILSVKFEIQTIA